MICPHFLSQTGKRDSHSQDCVPDANQSTIREKRIVEPIVQQGYDMMVEYFSMQRQVNVRTLGVVAPGSRAIDTAPSISGREATMARADDLSLRPHHIFLPIADVYAAAVGLQGQSAGRESTAVGSATDGGVGDACSGDDTCGIGLSLHIVAVVDEVYAVVDFGIPPVFRNDEILRRFGGLCLQPFIDVFTSVRLPH